MVGDLLHRIVARSVSGSHRLVSILGPRIVGQRTCRPSPLQAWDLSEVALWKLALHGFDKALSAQKDLLAQIVPETIQSDTCPDEVTIRRNRTTAGLTELTQQPIRFQPVRRGDLA